MKKMLLFSLHSLLILSLLSFYGCKKAPVNALQEFSPPLLWPPPPEKGRIKYLYSIAKPQDIGYSVPLFKKVLNIIVGEPSNQQIGRPYGIFFSNDEVLYVTDPGLMMVHVFNIKSRQYKQIKNFRKTGLLSPIGITMDDLGQLYVSDSVLKKVFVFKPDGKPIMEIGENNNFLRPTGILFHPALKRLYVVDTLDHAVKVFDLKGAHLFSFGGRGKEDGEFNFPTSLAIDGKGNIYVNDTLNFRIQIFNANGKFLGLFGRQGDGMGEFSHPKGIALDSSGNVYVADAIFDSVQIFNKAGDLLLYFGAAGQSPGNFWMPADIFIDGNDRIFISDSYNQRIQVYQFLGGGAQ